MAYEGYPAPPIPGYQAGASNIHMSESPDPQGYSSTPPYPAYHEEHLTMPQPQMPSDTSNLNLDPYSELPRPQTQNMATGNINDAVSSAVHNANSSTYLSPDVLSQITATVIQQLKVSGLNDLQSPVQGPAQPPAPAPAPTYQYPPPPPRPQSQQPPWGYTGPEVTPRPHSESPPVAYRSETIPQPNFAPNNYEPAQPYPPHTGYGNANDVRDARPNATLAHDGLSPAESISRSQSVSSQGSQHTPRPKGPPRDTTFVEQTTLEKIWGRLFEDGKPTERLGQFLRGIAAHLIEDYPPGNTLVITPAKLQKFYADTKVSKDNYPWHDIFDDHTSSISRMFRGVKVEHHLVQLDNLNERPDVPGLTPKGFERWTTLMIQAHPDREYERLQNAVLNMPISNPDDKKERFPKELPRRLFPEVADLKLREEVGEHIMEHCGVNLPRITDEERVEAQQAKKPEPTSSTTSTTTKVPSSPKDVPKSTSTSPLERTHSYERGRPPASTSTSTSAIIDDEEEVIASTPIERERKPYSSNPGGGKHYEESSGSRSHTNSFSTTRAEPSTSTTHRDRAHEKYDRGRESLYARSGSGPAPARRFSRSSRSSSRGVKNHSGDYRHSASELLDRDPTPRYSGSASDFYSESPVSLVTDVDDPRRHRANVVYRSNRDGEEYYRGMAGGQGGGPSEYKYYH